MKKEENTNIIRNNQKELRDIVAYLKGKQLIKTQKDLAEKINFDKSNLSSAINGNELYLTDSLFKKIYAAFPQLSDIKENTISNIKLNLDIKDLPLANQIEILNKKLDYIMQSEDLNRTYIKTLLAFHNVKIDMFESKEHELDQLKKTVN